MQIFSIGGLYIGKDDTSYTDICIHLGNYRLEYGGKPSQKDGTRSVTEESDRSDD